MSQLIKLLPDHIANQIAAGEVIQRPSSVVKELVENAIDAGATEIDVLIKDSGKTLIQVVDNGSGMSEIDARMSFERHATSKINSANDLFNLSTKGFRGEALASIAAIAHVNLKTRQDENEWGTSIQIEGTEIISQEPVTCKKGSSFSIKNLFFNVPARRNFLKSDGIEFKHIEDEFIRVVLTHPELKFTLTHNDQVVYHLEKSNIRKRIIDVFGRVYNDRIIPISEKTGIIEIEGFIGKPEFAKKSRGEQFLFVNNRFFRDNYFNHAIIQAYDNLLSPKTFPSYFIFFTINPSTIDVNVHPTKTEIKFENDKEIYAILKSTIRQGLGKFNISPSLDFEQETSFDLPWEMNKKPIVEPIIKVNPNYNPFSSNSSNIQRGNSSALNNKGFGDKEITQEDWKNFYSIEEDTNLETQTTIEINESFSYQFFFHLNYMLVSYENDLLIINIYRAKERLIYDELIQSFLINPIPSQQLLFPIIYELKPSLSNLWNENKKLILQLGFCFEVENNSINITGIPIQLENEKAQECIYLINEKLENAQIDKGELAHEFVISIAKSSAMQQNKMNQEEANFFFKQLLASSENQYSPSGKLIIKKLSPTDLKNIF
jgi:DNA mismatch repair protein MutL